ncbi:MAG: WYL domain-containing protein [Thioalkalispiraceae bacterium]|jgi:predicted DNA-binding transcriptional regulator YafY
MEFLYIAGIVLFLYLFGSAIKILLFEPKSISVAKDNIVKFDYTDGKGNKTKRKIRLSTTESEYGKRYINTCCFDAVDMRTFKISRMDNINVDGATIVTDTLKNIKTKARISRTNKWLKNLTRRLSQREPTPKNLTNCSNHSLPLTGTLRRVAAQRPLEKR